MGDSTIMNTVFSAPSAPRATPVAPVPAPALARWAAIAAERAGHGVVPRQAEAA